MEREIEPNRRCHETEPMIVAVLRIAAAVSRTGAGVAHVAVLVDDLLLPAHFFFSLFNH